MARDTQTLDRGKDRLLAPGVNCWRVARANRCALLVDGEAYFKAVHDAIGRARRAVWILGWDIDSRIGLVRGDGEDDRPTGLVEFLHHTLKRRRGLRIHVLVWDFSMVFALDREWPPIYSPRWRMHRRLDFHMDNEHPPGASHHQKIVVVDDAVAFVGGIDLTKRRWDTTEHAADQTGRLDPDGRRYSPFHDVQLVVDGAAAGGLGELARERWRVATGKGGKPPRAIDTAADPWPEGVNPDFREVDVGIARTMSPHRGRAEVREIERLYCDTIAAARRYIYIENQYLTSAAVGDALASRLQEEKGPEIVIVQPKSKTGWLEKYTMEVLRSRLLDRLRADDVHSRLGVFYPHIPGLGEGECVNVHAKVMISDDRLLRVGSSNISNRSMGLDSECDLLIDAAGDAEAERAVRGCLFRLLAEHSGREEKEVQEAIEGTGGLLPAIESFRDGERALRPLDGAVPAEIDRMVPDSAIVDPEKPVDPDTLLDMVLGEEPPRSVGKRLAGAAALLLGLLALAIAWRWTPLGNLLAVGRIEALAGDVAGSPWSFPIAMAGFVASSLLVVPVTLLISIWALIFGPWQGFFYSLAGGVLSAMVSFGIGKALGRDAIRRLAGRRINRLSKRLSRRGLLTVITLRIVPVAPFTVINLVAGASHIRFRDLWLGTFLGMAPGALALSFFADGMVGVLRAPNVRTIVWVGVLAVFLAGGGILASRWIRHGEKQGTGKEED
ncbi:MAG: VTT domain-containing protein [Candidatus Deferrimicrobiaceae bacterium]